MPFFLVKITKKYAYKNTNASQMPHKLTHLINELRVPHSNFKIAKQKKHLSSRSLRVPSFRETALMGDENVDFRTKAAVKVGESLELFFGHNFFFPNTKKIRILKAQ